MKCTCSTCNGSGRVQCYDCDGSGYDEISIRYKKLSCLDKHFEELSELQKDAKRIASQADRLKLLRPNRAKSYERQYEVTLAEIDRQADEISKRKPEPKTT